MRIGASLRIERSLYFDHVSAELDCHFGYDVIAPDPQRHCEKLRRNVPIAEVPSHAGGLQRISAADLKERLRCGNHFDQPTIFQDQRIAAVQPGWVGKIK
jgi:hypothetical protein